MRFQSLIAEFIGTFALIFVGMIASVAAVPDTIPGGGGNLLTVALAHGFIIAAMVSATAAISGGHLNPAVTLAMMATGKSSLVHGSGYIIVQLAGGIVGAFTVNGILAQEWIERANFAQPTPGPMTDPMSAMAIEAILTFFLLFVIFGTAVDKRAPKLGGLFIGLTITLDILIGGPLTGAAMNPARWLGPAVLSRQFSHATVYFVGPIMGALAAALLYRFMLEERAMPVVPEAERTA